MASLETPLSDSTSQPDEHFIPTPETSATSQSPHLSRVAKPPHNMSTISSTDDSTMQAHVVDVQNSISRWLKDKGRNDEVAKDGPLHLLDLPMDILKEIVKEITHTNDLTNLALTHSALHSLAIPHIYSRFDIVWPEVHTTNDPRTGVDALTYGLATLCMGELSPPRENALPQQYSCMNCGTLNISQCNHSEPPMTTIPQRRISNQYPQFTRKFSLGNGPPDWVQEYLITKESGKMLGTLVALAVGRMTNLETFAWDMPTGVLRDVWLALSSLQSRDTSQECRLERVWVRWHDNSDPSNSLASRSLRRTSTFTPQMLAGSTMTAIGWSIPPGSLDPSQPGQPRRASYAHSPVEYPTLSVLPPLVSLSVLDVDELDYLDEMSVSIARSKDILRELRVGISAKAINQDFTLAWDGVDLQQVDHNASWPGASVIGERRLGGVLGILLGRVHDVQRKSKSKIDKEDNSTLKASSTPIPSEPSISSPPIQTNAQNTPIPALQESSKSGSTLEGPFNPSLEHTSDPVLPGTDGLGLNPHNQTPVLLDPVQSDVESLTALMSAYEILPSATAPDISAATSIPPQPLRRSKPQNHRHSHFAESSGVVRQRLDGKLRLNVLELERVPLSIAVLHRAFDWSVLTELTLLDCPQHERLWEMLRRHFKPTPNTSHHSSWKQSASPSFHYHLNLKKVHTDAATKALISFLKETLAPNTLESLFLQDRRRSPAANVTIEHIYKGPLKRHRASLKKLMLDSSERIPRGPTSSTDGTRWRAWVPTREILNFITSGRMSSLRELGMAIDYKDWHHFLQRLRQLPHIRSLNIPFVADHVTPAFDPKELALQVVDVIVLCPEIELCYIGISDKCFEILENRPNEDSRRSHHLSSTSDEHNTVDTPTDDEDDGDEDEASDEEEDDDDEDDEQEDEHEDDDTGTAAMVAIDPDETEYELSDHDDSDTDSFVSADESIKVRLRLREILFYDDKVAIFKARHGKL